MLTKSNLSMKILYNDDEVKVFHPVVEERMNAALHSLNLDNLYEIEHHPNVPWITTIPDFGIKIKWNNKYIFLLEVKRTKRDVNSQRYWNQARWYVVDFNSRWQYWYQPYFWITNIEKTIMFCNKEWPLTSCIIGNNAFKENDFQKDGNADVALDAFELWMKATISQIHTKTQPARINNRPLIIESFKASFEHIYNKLSWNISPDVSKFEVWRFLFYSFLREYYQFNNNKENLGYFRNHSSLKSGTSVSEFLSTINSNFENVLRLDFK